MFGENGESTCEASSSGKQALMMSKRVLMDLVKTFIGLLERYQLQLEKDTEFIEGNRELLLGSVDYACSVLKLMAVKTRVSTLIRVANQQHNDLRVNLDECVVSGVQASRVEVERFAEIVCEFHFRGVL